MTMTYSFRKASEGGAISRKDVLALLRAAKIVARPTTSIYESHTAVVVEGGKKIQERAARLIFGGK